MGSNIDLYSEEDVQFIDTTSSEGAIVTLGTASLGTLTSGGLIKAVTLK